ncbi:MAG: nicotinate (nicotinamide) nucleotide adenylyltransferase [Roseibacillus sp.]
MGESEQKERIALFGGTFDPVHEGHIEVARNAVETLGLSRVVFLPCRQSPHKAVAAGASEEERLEMLKLATKDLAWAEVSDWEYHQPVPSFSWRTAEAFQERFIHSQLYWLMGWDQWKVLPSWNRSDYLGELVDFIVHARDGDGNGEELLKHPGTRVDFVTGDHPASSSEIRRCLSKGEGIPELWLHPEVEKLLCRSGLYLQ